MASSTSLRNRGACFAISIGPPWKQAENET
jgi:hypothetical protein